MNAAMLPTSRQFEAALRIVAQLRAAGHESYLAGGCVRDLLLGREPKDYDVATSATPDVVLKMFPRTFAVGARFGVVLVATRNEADSADASEAKLAPPQVVTEVATFRSDGAYTDGRHPDGVQYTSSAKEDVRRRDFTINGMLLDPLKGTGFSPYISSAKSTRALAPEEKLIQTAPPLNWRLPCGSHSHPFIIWTKGRGIVCAGGHRKICQICREELRW
jgi:hypothetical protein